MTRKALVVGIKPYPNFRGKKQRQDLANAPLDAEAIAQILRDYGRFEVKVLPETCAEGAYQVDEKGLVKAEMLQDAIYELFVEPADGKLPQTALLFFAGHGLAIDEYGETVGYLATSETNIEQKKWGVRLDWLAKQLGKSKVSEQIVWLDCCHSGRLTQEIFEQAKPANQNDVKRFIIAACRDSETAYGVDGHGVLTHLLQKALDPEQYSVGSDINSSEIQAAVEREFNAHPKFKTYPQRPIFFSFGRPIHFWGGRGIKSVVGLNPVSEKFEINIDTLVQQVRQSLHDKIQNLYGTMQLLDVAHPVEIGRLYVDVNVLDEPTSYKRLEINDLLEGRDYRQDFDRFGLSKVQQRVPGLQAVIDHPKLMVLGKPGAGKTTFLQHVVIECNNGNLLPDKVPILIKLRDFVSKAKKTENFSLENYVASDLRGCGQSEVTALLEAGKVLLLLDGLDEVSGVDSDVVVDEIREFIETYYQNYVILSCRIQAQKYRFERFAYVEVADFNSDQIATFARKYFVATAGKQGEAKAQQFLAKLNLQENQQIRELAGTPILLSLTCKVFGDTGKFYSKRHELYKEGLELLLSKWDDSRGIKRDNVYRDLSVKRKQELLSYIAAKKFEQSQYVLFTQDEIQGYIAEYLEISLEESQVVLEAIASQHGLLVERSQRIYSFSHLTFQEYFTAKYFVDKFAWQSLLLHLTAPTYSEVFKLTISMLNNADILLLLMLEKIHALVASDINIQHFLIWANQKSLSVKVAYKLAAIRALYLGTEQTLALDIQRMLSLNLGLDLDLNLDLRHELELDLTLILASNTLRSRERYLALDQAHNYSHDIKLKQLLGKLKKGLPDRQNLKKYKTWWQTNGQTWINTLKSVMKERRNIGHDWQFNNDQLKMLRQYYDSNKLLVDCLNSGCRVSDEVREEIEDTLLLPIAEIERRKRERQKGDNPE
ncbi:NACHT domain-containing protein [Kamptonema sp. UHCC 0994]|uniref:NACHT C-terminal helical domain 2-containing protein n=1 Tax=Kamptonema sp. UHCC 0994 TaxID=3031329 RepID=UPI0023B95D93|nr:NACHT domain-containing protein [Kamptonema sp. UHCC 0994]MDF0554057.1 caspase family protein [Kamptonema sp. UHCC 0994]